MTSPTVRELVPEDVDAVRTFFESMPAEDRTFFYQNVEDPSVIAAWAGDAHRVRRCAVDDDGTLLALAALQPGRDWTSHVADLVLLVAPAARRQQLGRTMARAMLIEAVHHGFLKVTVMIAADNEGAIDMFRKLGFEAEALLRDQLRNPNDGTLRDTVILSHLVEDNWSAMLTGGFEGAFA
ncbi:MAG: GNAT family N-acetyltransferase [Acidimicrobiales bacterium]